jgi:hypothetical protein
LVPLLLGVYAAGVVAVAVRFRNLILALFWPAAALFLICTLIIVAVDASTSARD